MSHSLQPHGPQASLSFTISQNLLELMSIESVMPSNILIFCCPHFLVPSILPSIRVFSNELFLPIKGQSIEASASASVLPMNIWGWFLLGWASLIFLPSKSLLQHHNLKASILQHSALFMIQLSHPYMTTTKTIALIIWTFAGNVISLLFNMLSRFVMAFLLRSKGLWILWLQSPCAVILKPRKRKSVTVSTFSPIYLPWSDGPRYHNLRFLNVEL